jgi:hypothetical protein
MVDVTEIKALLKKYFTILGNVTIQPDGVVDVKGQVFLKKKVKQFPVQFGNVSEAFACHEKSLTTLIGSPRRVGGDFTCWENALTTLQGAPDHVAGSFSCGGNKLVSLVGAPAHVGGNFWGGGLGGELLTSLEGAPNYVGGIFSWMNGPNLTSLEGAPAHVGREFKCTYNPHLPVLRTLMYPSVYLRDGGDKVNHILDKYVGQGKMGALKAAAELIRAGYKDNARW